MPKRYFVTSTGTGIGKTYATAALLKQARSRGMRVEGCKPVISGFDPAQVEDSDTGVLLAAMGLAATSESIARVSPWRFAAPLAPSMAARLEGRALDYAALVAQGRAAMDDPSVDLAVAEGVGGVMVPLDDTHTVLDWIADVGAPALFVAGSYLGTISHTLTALEVLRMRGVQVAGIVVNESEDSSVPLADTADEIRRWARGVRVVALPRHSAGEDLACFLDTSLRAS